MAFIGVQTPQWSYCCFQGPSLKEYRPWKSTRVRVLEERTFQKHIKIGVRCRQCCRRFLFDYRQAIGFIKTIITVMCMYLLSEVREHCLFLLEERGNRLSDSPNKYMPLTVNDRFDELSLVFIVEQKSATHDDIEHPIFKWFWKSTLLKDADSSWFPWPIFLQDGPGSQQ